MNLRKELSLGVSFQRRYRCCTIAGGDSLRAPWLDLILNPFRPFKAWVTSRASGGHGLADTCALFRLLLSFLSWSWDGVLTSTACSFAWATVCLWIWLHRRKMGLLSEKWTLIFGLSVYSEQICHLREEKLSTKMCFIRRLAEHLAFICFPGS